MSQRGARGSTAVMMRAALIGGLLLGAATARAANGDASDDAETITVTAQKRAEDIQQVPISITALDAAKLTQANVRTVQDLGRMAPNLQVTRGPQSAFLRLSVRGIGAVSNTTIEPSVALFVDGLYVPRAGAMVGALLDMEGVEILRGPQGTLFGRNASVGAIALRTATPKPELSAAITGEVGNADRYRLSGHFNLPLGEGRALRLAGLAQWFDGYWRNRLDGKRYGGTDDVAFRGSYRAESDRLEWIVRADVARINGDGYSNVDFDPGSVSAAQLAAFRQRLGGQLPDTDLDDRRLNQLVTAKLHDRQWGLSSTLSLDLDAGTVRLIDGYRDWSNRQLDGDVIYTPQPILSRVGRYRSKSQNHELQFLSPSRQWLDGHLDLVGGLYYFDEDYRLTELLRAREQSCVILLPAALRTPCTQYIARNPNQDSTDQQVDQSVHSYAGYGQATWHFSDQWRLTLGGRYTRDRKSGRYDQRIANPFVGSLRAAEALDLPKIDDGRFTWRASLNWSPAPTALVFANLSTGYKSAGYNSGAGAQPLSTFDAAGRLIATQRSVKRETSRNAELGAKTAWLGGALTANLTLYRMTIAGYQDRAFDGTNFSVRNAGKLRQQGFEAELAAAPVPSLRLSGAIAYLDSEFLDYPNAAGLPGIGGTQDLKDRPATYSPKWSGRIAAAWSDDLGSSGLGFTIATNLAFVSKQYQGLITDANPQTIQPGYALLGARITLRGPDDRWSIALFGNNLTDKRYSVGNFYQILDAAFGLRNGVFPGSSAVRVNRADPRSYGLSATTSF
jgi:iron complex outermembrane recepter protein